MIQVEHAVKEFKETTALRDVSVQFEKGKIYGLFGEDRVIKKYLWILAAYFGDD